MIYYRVNKKINIFIHSAKRKMKMNFRGEMSLVKMKKERMFFIIIQIGLEFILHALSKSQIRKSELKEKFIIF